VDNVILSVLAHPDDAEFLCAGTLIRLKQEHGWQVHIASMTAGDCGSADLPPDEISRVRRAEGAAAASLMGATYHCLDENDLLITYNERALKRVTRLMRDVRPRIVLTHSPADYLLDHEMTSSLARAAAFAAPVPNFHQDGQKPLDRVPHLYYCDPVQGKDALGQSIEPHFHVDITAVVDTKEAMLACHESQREWLRKHHGIDQYLRVMREWSRRQGQGCRTEYAEGFRQHLGHGYPSDNQLGQILGCVSPPNASAAGRFPAN
jgi:LmbE family N-acetylglucosaminyl deacetylase